MLLDIQILELVKGTACSSLITSNTEMFDMYSSNMLLAELFSHQCCVFFPSVRLQVVVQLDNQLMQLSPWCLSSVRVVGCLIRYLGSSRPLLPLKQWELEFGSFSTGGVAIWATSSMCYLCRNEVFFSVAALQVGMDSSNDSIIFTTNTTEFCDIGMI